MTTQIRIPTILGLVAILIGLVGGVWLVLQQQTLKSRADMGQTPKEVTAANLSGSSAAIYWQTDQPTTGWLELGLASGNLNSTHNDDRDTKGPSKHLLHFISLTNLRPETTYFYRINSGGDFSQTRSFTTPVTLPPSSMPPLIGTVANSNLQPAEEALVIFAAPNSQTLATISKLSGNFILSLSEIKTEDLTTSYDLGSAGTEVSLKIIGPDSGSEILLETPLPEQLPTLILGQNRRIEPVVIPTPTPSPLQYYDLNSDGKLDDKDRSIIRANFFKSDPTESKADINQDGVINQSDLSAFNAYLASVTQTPTPARTTPAPR